MRRLWLGVAVALAVGCNAILGNEAGQLTPTGSTSGSGGSSTSTGAMGGSGGAAECAKASDCPPTGTDCGSPTCKGGVCAVDDAAAATSCSDHSGKVCDGLGHCVACNTGSDCESRFCTSDNKCSPWVTAISAGQSHACAITPGGGAKCWGYNYDGELGLGSTKDQLTAVDVTGLTSGVTAISAGSTHTCAVLSTGGAKCWGAGAGGVLGDNNTFDQHKPVDVSLLTDAKTVAVGSDHVCALTSLGGVKCWGTNNVGQLGDNFSSASSTPVAVSGLDSGVSMISAGAFHTCAVTTSGGALCWGGNLYGQLGNLATDNALAPADVYNLTVDVKAITAGTSHTCALKNTGSVRCWGDNESGQIGDGTSSQRPTAVEVPSLTTGVSAIAAGAGHTCALTAGGGVKCWGMNDHGELGNGFTTASSTPVDVVGLSEGVAAITAGLEFSCALMKAGSVVCWGQNSWGALGVGSSKDHHTPAEVVEK